MSPFLKPYDDKGSAIRVKWKCYANDVLSVFTHLLEISTLYVFGLLILPLISERLLGNRQNNKLFFIFRRNAFLVKKGRATLDTTGTLPRIKFRFKNAKRVIGNQ